MDSCSFSYRSSALRASAFLPRRQQIWVIGAADDSVDAPPGAHDREWLVIAAGRAVHVGSPHWRGQGPEQAGRPAAPQHTAQLQTGQYSQPRGSSSSTVAAPQTW
jgi:hypothetical protein